MGSEVNIFARYDKGKTAVSKYRENIRSKFIQYR